MLEYFHYLPIWMCSWASFLEWNGNNLRITVWQVKNDIFELPQRRTRRMPRTTINSKKGFKLKYWRSNTIINAKWGEEIRRDFYVNNPNFITINMHIVYCWWMGQEALVDTIMLSAIKEWEWHGHMLFSCCRNIPFTILDSFIKTLIFYGSLI